MKGLDWMAFEVPSSPRSVILPNQNQILKGSFSKNNNNNFWKFNQSRNQETNNWCLEEIITF